MIIAPKGKFANVLN